MRLLTSLVVAFLLSQITWAQGTKIELTTCKELGQEGPAILYEVGFKVLNGKIEGTGRKTPFALPLPNGTKAFAYIEPYDDVVAGKAAPSPVMLKVYGQKVQAGKTLVSHDLAVVKAPSKHNFEFKSTIAFLGDEPQTYFSSIEQIKGFAAVGDEIAYTNARGQQGRGKIEAFEVEGGYRTNLIFEGIPDGIIQIKISALGKVDFSDSKVMPARAATPITPSGSTAAGTAKSNAHKIKTIPIEAILENKEVKITVHNLVKFNPDSTDRTLDLFKVDYSFDYYIVDATVENKTNQPLDISAYLLRFNFFTKDGKSADDYLRVLNEKKSAGKPAQKDADKIDTNVFGGSSKLPMASVMVKYETTLTDYDTKYKPQTNALNKPFEAKQKTRSVNATILGVPPSYTIEGLGTWEGVFLDKNKILFVPIRIGK